MRQDSAFSGTLLYMQLKFRATKGARNFWASRAAVSLSRRILLYGAG